MPFFQGVFGKNYYEVHGEGLPVILIPGMGASHQEWFQQVPVLSKDFKVITIDNAGSGRSVHPDTEISIPQMAVDISRLIDHLKLDRVVLVGSSMGGLIAQCCLEIFPDKIAGVVLSATFDHVNSHIIQVLSPILRSRQSPKVRVQNVLPLLVSKDFIKEKPKIARRYVTLAEKFAPPREVLQRQVRAVLNFTPHPPRKTPTLPMMILVGSDDTITTPAMAESLHHRYPQSKLHIFEGARHLLHVERAEEFNKKLQAFLFGRLDLGVGRYKGIGSKLPPS
ncbi:MAG: alpha/beta hydrolase [Deltaproteobacteria bacterium]|nr:alpha/beta hydrolase [Deltaproteobacteria bacterium]